jgi:hypothetical protein
MRGALALLFALALGALAAPKRKAPRAEHAHNQLLESLGRGGHVADVARVAQSIHAGRWDEAVIESLAKLGGAGAHENNYERDLHRWVRKQPWANILPRPYDFTVHVALASASGVRDLLHSALLPHEFFASVYEGAPDLFKYLFVGDEQALRNFWVHNEGTEWFRRHPVVRDVPDPTRRIPIGIHGDDVGVYWQDKVLVLTWGSVAVEIHSVDTRILFSCIRCGDLIPDVTMKEIHRVLVWSFEALAAGRWPGRDHNGVPFTDQHHPLRASRAGDSLAGGYVGAWSECRGDWKYLMESLALAAFYACNECCHLCRAHKKVKRLIYTQFDRTAYVRRTCYSNDTFLGWHRGRNILQCIPGFDIWRCWVDAMHTIDLGILMEAVPSALCELCKDDSVWDGGCVKHRMYAAWEDYCQWCRANGCETIAPRFESVRIRSSEHDYPSFTQKSAKAASSRGMQYWLAEVCAARADCNRTDVNLQMAGLFLGLASFDITCRGAGRHPTTAEAETMADHMESALVFYNALHAGAAARGEHLWKVLPKHHMVTHMVYDQAPLANPRWVHCYGDEDMVGRVKKLVNTCHGATCARKAILRYLIIVGLRWLRLLGTLRGLPPGIF